MRRTSAVRTQRLTARERWSSVDDVAGHLGVRKESVYRSIESSRMPAHQMGRLWRFKMSEVDAWVLEGGAAGGAADGR
jgi:excisionase family DNA binding protein